MHRRGVAIRQPAFRIGQIIWQFAESASIHASLFQGQFPAVFLSADNFPLLLTYGRHLKSEILPSFCPT